MKRALLIGINYIGTSDALNGCINDIRNINRILTTSFSYASNNVRVLTDDQAKTGQNYPTRSNMEQGIKWLTTDCKAGDTLVFYFSGHGTRVRDRNADETDGFDEVLVPVDYDKNGVITDDWLFANLAAVLPKGVTLWAFTDCCHSGTMFDLKFSLQCNSVYTNPKVKPSTYNSREWTNRYGFTTDKKYRDTVANVYMFSGCLDPQTSADAYIRNQSQGAFTACLIECLNNNSTQTNGRLVLKELKLIEMLKEINCRLVINGFDQRCQLSTGMINAINDTLKF